jgi:hypothetical protein
LYASVRSPPFSAQHGEIQYDINTRYQCFGSGFIQVHGSVSRRSKMTYRSRKN